MKKLTEEQFERKGLLIMSMIGVIIILNIFAYNLYQNHFKKDNIEFDGQFIFSQEERNETCLCSTKCALRLCIWEENKKISYQGDSFIINNNLTEEHCETCEESSIIK